MMNISMMIGAGALIIAVASTAAAQDSTRVPATLGAVVVTATRTQTTLEQMPLHTSVLTQAEIRRSPAQSLDQLLREVPGMNIPGAPFYTTDPTGHQSKLRGVTNSKVLMLVDGIPIHDPFYSTTQWFKVPLSSIERVEVVRGGSSSLWGNLAVAGVVNIITKKPFDDSGEIAGSLQSRSTSAGALSKNFAFENGVSVRVSGDVLKSGGYQTTPEEFLSTVPGKSASTATNGNVQVAAYYAPTDALTAFVRAGYHQQNEDIGGYAFGKNLQKNPDAAAGMTKTFSEHTRADVRLWGQRVDFDKYNGAGCYLASATNCNTTSTTSPLVQYANSHDTNPYHELGGSAILSTSRESGLLGTVQAGVDARRIGGEDHATTYNRPTTTDASSSTINRTNFGRGTQQFIGTFTQFVLRPAAALDVTASARYDYWLNTNGVSEMVRYTSGAPGATAGGVVPDSHQGSFNPSVSARYRIGGGVSVRGAAYKSFRAPGLNNLYRSFSSTTSITIANPTLSPERLLGGEVGLDFQRRRLALGATWFEYDTRNLIASYRIPNAAAAPPAVVAICGPTLSNCPATVNFNTNGQDAISRGLEFTMNVPVLSSLSMGGSYSYTDSHYILTTTGDPTNVQLGAIPKSLGALGLSWNPTSRFSSYLGAHYSSSMYLDVNQTIPQASYTLLNASASFSVQRDLELTASVVNATNVGYADNSTTSAAGKTLGMPRSLTSGLRWRF